MAASQPAQLDDEVKLPLRGLMNDVASVEVPPASRRLGFLDLPAEIREQVYEHLFNDASYYPCNGEDFDPRWYERYHAYPTFRRFPPSDLPHVWKDNTASTKVHWQLPPMWRSHRLPPDVVGRYRSLWEICRGYTWPKRQFRLNLNGLMFTSRLIYEEACRQYHQHTAVTCRSPVDLFDLTHRTHECGTASQVRTLTLMVELNDLFSRWPWYRDDPDCAGNDFVENARLDQKLRHDWIGLLAVAQPNFITEAFPNLKTLEIHFAYRLVPLRGDEYEYHCVHEDHEEKFVEFITEHFAPKIFGQEQLGGDPGPHPHGHSKYVPRSWTGVTLCGLDKDFASWIYQGITGTWEPFEGEYQDGVDE